MPAAETRYARAGDVEIAYQTVGDGPVDLVWAFGLMTHLEIKWEEPRLAAMLEQLSSFTRLILFDRRGCGLSDRGDRHLAPTLEERVEDVVAVLDAVGSRRASFFGVSEGCALAALFASKHPDRTERLILYGGISRLLRDAEHPWGVLDPEQYEAAFGPMIRHWGTPEGAAAQVRMIAPSVADDPEYLAWFARQQRLSLSRDAVERFMNDAVAQYDLDEIFPSVRAPTLVLHRSGDAVVPTSSAHRLVSRIPGSRLVELPGVDHLPYVGDFAPAVDATREFLGVPTPPMARDQHRVVTLLAVDAPGARMGDADAALVRRHARRWDGAEARTATGDGLVRFESATRAVRCALGILAAAHERGADLRAAVHTGECAVTDGAVDGPVAHVPTALLREAPPGRVVATATVRDVVPGSGIDFTDERRVRLPGAPGGLVVTAVAPTSGAGPAPDGGPGGEGTVPGPEQVFRRDGEYWTVAFEGRVVTLRDSKGMRDLATLLAAPGRERHALDLWAGPGAPGTAPAREEALAVSITVQPVVDDEARAQYRRRLAALDEAAGEPDRELAAGLAEERDWLVRELAAAYGVGGRSRPVADHAERARKAVYRRVTDAVRRIERAHPALGRHLRHAVHTGVYCSYAPERELTWVTDGGRSG